MPLAEKLAVALALCLSFPAAARALNCPADVKDLPRRIVTCQAGVGMAQCRKTVATVGCSIVRELPSINAVVVTVPRDAFEAAAARLSLLPQIRRLEEDKYVNWLKLEAPALPRFEFPPIKEMFPGLAMSGPVPPLDAEQPWGIARVNAAAAWDKTMGRGVKVAVIDTGIDNSHPDLAPNVKGGFNALEGADPAKFQDDQGHGSHVAGTIAAIKDGKGVVGVAPQADLYAVKVLDSEGGGNYSTIIAGIEWCVKNGMQVANMSLGASEGTPALQEAIVKAQKAGLVILAAAGNDSGGPVGYPAAYPETIAVTASDNKDRFAYFSSKGPQTDFIAPGQDVKSVKMGGGYVSHSGTSMATPHMSGLAALAVASGARGQKGVLAVFQAAASPLPGLTAEQQGAGLVDAAKVAR
ncbi:MAG: S8 family peptidase [Elusimicrobia bacterium]|nr:S8 family peptidase [Elusimicrobiota bacterium]